MSDKKGNPHTLEFYRRYFEEGNGDGCTNVNCGEIRIAELEAAVDKVLSRTTSMPEDMKKLYGIDALEPTKEELPNG